MRLTPMAIQNTMSAPMTTHQPASPSKGTSRFAAAAPETTMMAVHPTSWMTLATANRFDPTWPNDREAAPIADAPVLALT